MPTVRLIMSSFAVCVVLSLGCASETPSRFVRFRMALVTSRSGAPTGAKLSGDTSGLRYAGDVRIRRAVVAMIFVSLTGLGARRSPRPRRRRLQPAVDGDGQRRVRVGLRHLRHHSTHGFHAPPPAPRIGSASTTSSIFFTASSGR